MYFLFSYMGNQFTLRGDTAIAPGKRRISAAFDADTATPGTMTLFTGGIDKVTVTINAPDSTK